MMLLLQQVTQWWIVLFFLGLLALPLATKFFTGFFDKGYVFSKTIGIILLVYSAFFLGTIHVVAFSQVHLYILVVFFLIISFWLYWKWQTATIVKNTWKIFLFEEILFFLGLFTWSYVKSFQPDIHGLEKFMDFGFINSILRSTYFPPRDMWMTPLSINYYYFGHLTTAVLTKVSNLPSNVTFNLMLASIFAFTFTSSFSLGGNFVYILKKSTSYKKIIVPVLFAGIITAFLVTFAGNLQTLYTLFTPYQNENPVPPTQLIFSPTTFPNSYWYPNATRFIYHTIHEFPVYSFVVSDLHGHVLDIPFVLLAIAMLFTIFLTTKSTFSLLRNALLLGSMSAIMYMTNAWDGLIYIGISVVLLFLKAKNTSLIQTLFSRDFVLSIIYAFGSFIIVGLPFSFFFKPFASQIGINCAPDFLLKIGHIGPIVFENGYCQQSPLWQLIILYGFFLFWLVSLITFLFAEKKTHHKLSPSDLFVASLGVLGILLISIPEFVYLKDIYTTYFRANTMFKLVYQSFILLSLVSGYSLYRVYADIFERNKKSLIQHVAGAFYVLFTIILLSFVFIYPYFAINSYFDNLKNFQGLNGTTYLKTISQGDSEAVMWLNKNIKGQPVILEAQGDSYTDFARISSNTGLPTVFGWTVHEWLWRNTYDIAPPRIADVQMLYESKDIAQTKSLIEKYHVQYVYIGNMERQKYKVDEEKFDQLGKVVYKNDQVILYKIF